MLIMISVKSNLTFGVKYYPKYKGKYKRNNCVLKHHNLLMIKKIINLYPELTSLSKLLLLELPEIFNLNTSKTELFSLASLLLPPYFRFYYSISGSYSNFKSELPA